ncbi:hypothetical protein TJA_23790 [Thermus sp. LT1-2-5]|uniref:Eco57I restriction-modification methylase domain-containing protein n=1 Tax=Thermus sp. LT1-2-5 TaxID=3026935 RepID=UPI0030E8225D
MVPVRDFAKADREPGTLRVEGGLFGPDFLEALRRGEVPFQGAKDFGLPPGRALQEEISETYEEAKALYSVLRKRIEGALGTEAEGELTRRWVRSFLELLGYRLHHRGWAEAGGKRYEILYGADEAPESPPVHVVPWSQDLSRAGRRGRSPHGLLQDYLNASDHLWGLVTNGRHLRLLRDSPFVRRQAYLEVDLEALMEEDRPEEFALVYRLLHRSRLPKDWASAKDSPMERYFQQALAQGERAKERLREAVEGFLVDLGTGFLRGPGGQDLARNPEALYHDLLRVAYRVLFLLVAEARGVLGGNEFYRQAFSVRRLLDLSADREAYTEDIDLWLGLKTLFHLLRDPSLTHGDEPAARVLGLEVLNGRLFEPIPLEEGPYAVENRHLLRAFHHLAFFFDEKDKLLKRINYAALDVEELGSVYESLLDHTPVVEGAGGERRFAFRAGTERKRTGSYYTPDSLVDLVLREALDPVVAERLKEAGDDPKAQEQAILSLKVIDPASGSGHFLLGAARRLARRLAQVRTGEEEPSPEVYRQAVRDVVANCLYAVDLNPLAVELCRVALWMESHVPGKPLTFLDHRIKCGNSLVGVLDPRALVEGIPDGAFAPKEGDAREVASFLKKENRRQRRGEQTLFAPPRESVLEEEQRNLATVLQELARLPEDRAQDVAAKARRYEDLQGEETWGRLKLASDLWTAAFFQGFSGGGPFITTEAVWRALEGGVDPVLRERAEALAQRHRFFHWWLEFPEVFAHGGFDVVLGNPPWDQVQFDDEEFFREVRPDIANAANMAKRKAMIQKLPQEDPALWGEYQDAMYTTKALQGFIHHSGRFPLTSSGRLNLAPLFAEKARTLRNAKGWVGLIVPTGIATDSFTQFFFADLVQKGELAALLDFENREKLFPAVDSRLKFAVFALRPPSPEPAKLAFFLTQPDQALDPTRTFSLEPQDFALLNPNTKTCPVFRTRQDAELTKAIYKRVPVLWREDPEYNPWKVRLVLMFMMNTDSYLFRTQQDLKSDGFSLEANRFVRGSEVFLPLYEAKMIWHYDHRFATYEGKDTRDLTPEEHQDPTHLPLPRYWVSAKEVEERLEVRDRQGKVVWRWERSWLMGWRDITNATNERTMVASAYPRVGAGDTFLQMLPSCPAPEALLLLGSLNSLVVDYATRQKIGGTHLKYHVVKQLPILPPNRYTEHDLRFIVPRVLELTYTAWDLAPLAQEVWEEADEGLREAIRRWREAAPTHPDKPPSWLTHPYPFPPFQWDEDRRARLRAELDAYYARLYGLNRKQIRYILDPQDLTQAELEDILSNYEEVKDPLDEGAYQKRRQASAFPGETFRVLRDKDERRYGEYRTRRLVLEAWNRLSSERGGAE